MINDDCDLATLSMTTMQTEIGSYLRGVLIWIFDLRNVTLGHDVSQKNNDIVGVFAGCIWYAKYTVITRINENGTYIFVEWKWKKNWNN